jgi:hypothetical protein
MFEGLTGLLWNNVENQRSIPVMKKGMVSPRLYYSWSLLEARRKIHMRLLERHTVLPNLDYKQGLSFRDLRK